MERSCSHPRMHHNPHSKKGRNESMRTCAKRIMKLGCAAALLLPLLAPAGVSEARDSKFTRGGAGPLYWITYEYQYDNNTFMPYDRWEANVKWVAENFKPYGFDMVSTDGWIEGATVTNENGYILSHNDSWLPEHTWENVTKSVNERGLKMGVYYNPLWVTQAAVKDPAKKVVGTDIKIADIVEPGDFFTGDPNPARRPYWVDVTKPGAEEYVKGYVRYFKNMGVKFLRIDFLSWYETGTDNGNKVGKGHGTDRYETALRWMKEAAGDDLWLSLVMPHMKNHGEKELLYGDMVRINEDVFKGGWEHLSGRGQLRKDGWSQWANSFQGFTGFSDISGRSQMVLDGDFQRLRKLKNDGEKRTSVTLSILAGGPVAIADEYDTLAPQDYKFYQNEELLALNKMGFAGKPVFQASGEYKKDSRDSETWVGQLPGGEWVVGLFNREGSAKTKSVDFAKTLGIIGKASVRDIWERKDLGGMAAYEASIEPHDVKVLKVTPDKKNRFEAEVASTRGSQFNNALSNASGFGYVDKLDGDHAGAKVTFAVESDQDGSSDFLLRYTNGTSGAGSVTVSVKDLDNREITPAKTVKLPQSGEAWKTARTSLRLGKGTNLITVERASSDTGSTAVDYIERADGSTTDKFAKPLLLYGIGGLIVIASAVLLFRWRRKAFKH